jgi:hypothetical protein
MRDLHKRHDAVFVGVIVLLVALSVLLAVLYLAPMIAFGLHV